MKNSLTTETYSSAWNTVDTWYLCQQNYAALWSLCHKQLQVVYQGKDTTAAMLNSHISTISLSAQWFINI